MHAPYIEQNAPKSIHKWDISPEVNDNWRKYYTVCNYTDSVIGSFVNNLKAKNIYDNSVVVIVSDHAGPRDYKEQEQPIAFIALNSGMHKQELSEIEQIDIYPTILDIMGCHNYFWKGMGYSIFSKAPKTRPNTNKVNRLILMGNYYGK